jgi:hypothetical protein
MSLRRSIVSSESDNMSKLSNKTDSTYTNSFYTSESSTFGSKESYNFFASNSSDSTAQSMKKSRKSNYSDIYNEQQKRLSRLKNKINTLRVYLAENSLRSCSDYTNQESNSVNKNQYYSYDVTQSDDKTSTNNLSLYIYDEFNKNITVCLKEAVYLLLSRILIEYLTFNVGSLIKNELRKTLLYEIKEYFNEFNIDISYKSLILENMYNFESSVRERMLFHNLSNQVVSKISMIFKKEIEDLKESVLHEYDKCFYRTFQQPFKILRFRMKKLTENEIKYSKYIALMTDESDQNDYDSCNAKNINKQQGDLSFFRRFLLFHLFFPNFVYKIDLVNSRTIIRTHFFRDLIKEGTKLNNYVKFTTGLFFAWLLTYIIYTYIRYEIKLDGGQAFISLIVIFSILSIGLGQNHPKFRCITLLVIPFMASSRGRTFLIMNCVNLSSSHVLTNLFKNIQILTLSYSCYKQMIANELKILAKENDITRWTYQRIDKIKELSEKMSNQANTIKNVAKKTGSFIKKGYQGIKKATQICSNFYANQKERCVKNYNQSGYLTQLGGIIIHFNCSIISEFKSPCDVVKKTFKDIGQDMIENIEQHLNETFDPLINEFRFEKKITKKSLKSRLNNETKSVQDISAEIFEIYYEKIEWMKFAFDKVKFLFPISLVLVILKAIKYHDKYLKSDYFHNYVLGVKFYELDHKRKSKSLPTLLPLNDFLRDKFVGLFDSYLTQKEIDLTNKSIIALVLVLAPIYFAMLADHFMFKLNDYFYFNGKIDIQLDYPVKSQNNSQSMTISNGGGFAPNFYSELISILDKDRQNNNVATNFSNEKCLPQSSEPNYQIYTRIYVYTVIVFLLTLFQAYIKRWRSAFAGFVYPDRDLERSVWLYNHLLSINTSLGFIKPEKGKPKSKFIQFMSLILKILYFFLNLAYTIFMSFFFYYFFCLIPRKSLKTVYLTVKTKILILIMRFKKLATDYCTLCGDEPRYFSKESVENNEEEESFVKCSNESCKGFYCVECFTKLSNICKLCKFEIISDLDKISLVFDWSDGKSINDDDSVEDNHSSSNESNENDEKRVDLVLEQFSTSSSVDNSKQNNHGNKRHSYFKKNSSASKKREIRFLDKDLDFSYQDAKKTLDEYLRLVSNQNRESNLNILIDAQEKILNNSYKHNLHKFDTEIIHYDLNRTQQHIESSIKILYKNIERLIDHNLFSIVIKLSTEIKAIFSRENPEYDLFDVLTRQIYKNYILNLTIKEYFDFEELDTPSFYYYLSDIDFSIDSISNSDSRNVHLSE